MWNDKAADISVRVKFAERKHGQTVGRNDGQSKG
jgi:hypothetical protein